jgi:hypothetical protein
VRWTAGSGCGRPSGGEQRRAAAGRRRLAGSSPTTLKIELPATELDEINTKTKQRGSRTYPGTCRGGRTGGEGDQAGGAPAGGSAPTRHASAKREREQGMVGIWKRARGAFYRWRGEGVPKAVREASSLKAPLMSVGASVGGGFRR